MSRRPGDRELRDRARAAAAAWEALDLRLCRAPDASYLTEALGRDELTGRPVRLTAEHREMHAAAAVPQARVVDFAHPEAGKSFNRVWDVASEIGRNPRLRCAWVSNTWGMAVKPLRLLQRILTSDAFRHVFPGVRPAQPWADGVLTVERPTLAKDPTVQAVGLHGAILGSRLDLVIVDDLDDWESTRTPGQRETAWLWFVSSVISRLTPEAKVLCSGVVLHRDDVLHHLLRSGGAWAERRYPVIDRGGRPTWPERWPLARCERRRAEIGSYEWERQYLCITPTDADRVVFRRSWLEGEGSCADFTEPLQAVHVLDAVPPGCVVATGADLAVSLSARSDRSAFTTVLRYPTGETMILETVSGKWTGEQIIERLIDVHARLKGTLFLETNGAFQYIAEFLKARAPHVPVRPIVTSAGSKWGAETGLFTMGAEVEARKFMVPAGPGGVIEDPEIKALVEDASEWVPGQHTPDRLMSLLLAWQGSKQLVGEGSGGKVYVTAFIGRPQGHARIDTGIDADAWERAMQDDPPEDQAKLGERTVETYFGMPW